MPAVPFRNTASRLWAKKKRRTGEEKAAPKGRRSKQDNNFGSRSNTFGSSYFGAILNTVAPPTGPYGSFATGLPSGRIIQFQGKFVF